MVSVVSKNLECYEIITVISKADKVTTLLRETKEKVDSWIAHSKHAETSGSSKGTDIAGATLHYTEELRTNFSIDKTK